MALDVEHLFSAFAGYLWRGAEGKIVLQLAASQRLESPQGAYRRPHKVALAQDHCRADPSFDGFDRHSSASRTQVAHTNLPSMHGCSRATRLSIINWGGFKMGGIAVSDKANLLPVPDANCHDAKIRRSWSLLKQSMCSSCNKPLYWFEVPFGDEEQNLYHTGCVPAEKKFR